MKLFRLFSVVTLLAFLTAFVSCKTTYPTEKYFQGKWVPVKVEKYMSPEKVVKADKQAPPKEKSVAATADSLAKQPATTQEDPRSNQLDRMVIAEKKATMEVYPEKKLVVKNYNSKVAKAKYKLKKKGYQVKAKELETGKQLTLDIVSINDSSAVVIEKFPFGEILIEYKKDIK